MRRWPMTPPPAGGCGWVSRCNGPSNRFDAASAVAVSPSGTTVSVTGTSFGRGGASGDYATVAYSAATGRRLWVGRYNGPGNGFDGASALAVSPAGSRVFVTGHSYGRVTGFDYATVAYSAATGRQLWVSRYNGAGNGFDAAASVAVSPAGTAVFVTGYGYDMTTKLRLRHRCLPRLRPPVLPGQRIARAARPRVADRPIPAGPGERTVRSVRADQGQA